MRLMSIIFMSLIPILLGGCGESHDHVPEKHQKSEKLSSDVSEIENHKKSACPTKEGCFICDPNQREKERLWCKEHHRYEDRCWLCHPELEEKGRLYCSEHGIYEDECYICHPNLKANQSSNQIHSERKP